MGALADMYDASVGASGASAAAAGTTAAATTTPSTPIVSLDEMKTTLMEVVKKEGGKRDTVDKIFKEHAGGLMKADAVPEDKRAAVLAAAKAFLAAAEVDI